MAALLHASASQFAGAAIAATKPTVQQRVAVVMPVRAAQSLQGKVVSVNTKTAIVAVETKVVHPVYKKIMKRTTKYTAHDETEQCKEGDVVTLAPSRPLSKTKRFAVAAVVQSAN